MSRRGDTHRVMRWLWTSRRPDAREPRVERAKALQRLVENPLALRLLEGDYAEGDTVHVDAKDGELVVERAAAREPAVA